MKFPGTSPFTTVSALLVMAIAAAPGLAQYTGPGARSDASRNVARTVAEVLRNPVDDQPVQLTGVIVRQTGRETYVFRDDTGEIQVEIDREDFPAGQITPSTRLSIWGEVDDRFLRKPEIDVEKVTLAQPGQ